MRDLSNHTITLNPLVRHGLTSAAAIFTKTPDTARILTPSMQRKSINFLELGLESARPSGPKGRRGRRGCSSPAGCSTGKARTSRSMRWPN